LIEYSNDQVEEVAVEEEVVEEAAEEDQEACHQHLHSCQMC
jgi:hypothetical protein